MLVSRLSLLTPPYSVLLQGRAWRAWLEYIEDRQAAKLKTRSAATFWQNHQSAVAFQQWQEQVVIAKQMKAKAAVIVGRLRNSTQVSLQFIMLQLVCLLAKPEY